MAGVLAWKGTGSVKGQAGEPRMGCLCQCPAGVPGVPPGDG